MKNFIREKKIYSGEYLDVDIIPVSENQLQKGRRGKKKKATSKKQENLNEKNAKRYLAWRINTNFGKQDVHLTLTYDDEHLPGTVEEGENNIKYFLRAVRKEMRAIGKELKYIIVTEYMEETNEQGRVRMHHHMIMNGGIDRDKLESMWCVRKRGRKKKDYEAESLGRVNADRLQPDENGFEALAKYITKLKKSKRRWSCSKNLKSPVIRTNDSKYSRRKVESIAREAPEVNIDYWERQYPGYKYTDCQAIYNDITGWSIYLKMRKNSRNNT